MMWLSNVFALFCCSGDEDWIPTLVKHVSDPDGPLAEECCDVSRDNQPLEYVVLPSQVTAGKQPGSGGPETVAAVAQAIAQPVADTEAGALAQPTTKVTAITFGDIVVTTYAPTTITFGDIDTEVAGECIASFTGGVQQAVEEANTVSQAPAEGPEMVDCAVAQVSARQEEGFAKRVTRVEVDQHRRCTSESRLVSAIVCEIKAKLGMPIKNAANTLTIRYLANSRCKDLGVRPAHARAIVELVIVLVYAPDVSDVRAAELQGSNAIRRAHADHSYATKSKVYKAFVPRCVHSLFASGPVTGSATA